MFVVVFVITALLAGILLSWFSRTSFTPPGVDIGPQVVWASTDGYYLGFDIELEGAATFKLPRRETRIRNPRRRQHDAAGGFVAISFLLGRVVGAARIGPSRRVPGFLLRAHRLPDTGALRQ